MKIKNFLMSQHSSYRILASGLTWSDINTPASPDQRLTMLQILLSLAADSVIFLIITWYVEAVNPKTEGITQPFYFFLKPSYWFPSLAKKASEDDYLCTADYNEDNEHVEKNSGAKPTIRAVNLSKNYDASCFSCKVS